MSSPIELLVAAFDGEHSAETALTQLREMQKDGVVSIVNAAVLVKTSSGQAHIKETEDVRAPAGAVFGAIVGGLMGLIGGPAGAIVGAAAGAAAGGVAAHKIDMGFTNTNLEQMQALLPAGSSAIIAMVTLDWVERVSRALEALNARLLHQSLTEEALGAGPVIEGQARVITDPTPQSPAGAEAAQTPAPEPPAAGSNAPTSPEPPPPAAPL
jgi:uncharacterized membrane protein